MQSNLPVTIRKIPVVSSFTSSAPNFVVIHKIKNNKSTMKILQQRHLLLYYYLFCFLN